MDTLEMLKNKMEIEELMTDYWWYVDSKQWDKLVSDVMTEDLKLFVSLKGPGEEPIQTATSAREWADNTSAQLANRITVHQGHQSKIVFTSDTTAKGKFILNDHLYSAENESMMHGYGYYVDDYVKVNGKWKISVIRLGYIMIEKGPAAVIPRGFCYPEAEF